MTTKLKRLILLDNVFQYQEFRKLNQEEVSIFEDIFCALTPYTLDLCERENLNHVSIGDTHTPDEYYLSKQQSEGSIKRLVSLLNAQSKRKPLMEADGFEIELGNYFYFQLYVVLGSLHFRSFLLDRLIACIQPDSIVCFRPIAGTGKEYWPNPLSGEVYSSLLESSPHGKSITTIRYEYEPGQSTVQNGFKHQIRERLRQLALSSPLLSELYAKFDFIKKDLPLASLVGRANHKIKLLAIGPLYNWLHVFKAGIGKDLFAVEPFRGTDVMFVYDKSSHKNLSVLEREIQWEPVFAGFDLTAEMRPHFAVMEKFESHIRKHHHQYVNRVKKFDHVVCSALAFAKQNYLAHIATTLGKSVFCYQHGEMNLYEDALSTEATELLYSTHYLSFGEGVNTKYHALSNSSIRKVISVGSTTIEHCADEAKTTPGKDYILYTTAKYHLNVIPFIAVMDCDRRLYRTQRELLGYFEALLSVRTDLSVFFKPSNTRMHNELSLTFEKVRVADAFQPFTQLMSRASIIVLDSPATTAIEASCTDKPIFALLNRSNWFPESAAAFSKRAVTARTSAELIAKLSDFFATGRYDADIHDRSFAKKYAIGLGDGRAADRVIAAILAETSRLPSSLAPSLHG
jgi:hypothetical protein